MKLFESVPQTSQCIFKTTFGGLLYYNVTPERVEIAARWVLTAIVLGCWLRQTRLPCFASERTFLFVSGPHRLEMAWSCWFVGGRRSGRFPPSTQIVRKIRVHEKQLSSAPGWWKAIRALARAPQGHQGWKPGFQGGRCSWQRFPRAAG